MIKVFGHLSPDTDTVVSAIVWSWYLNNHTTQKSEAFVLGELNKETSFVLNRWNIKTPVLLESVVAGDDVIIVDTNNPQELFSNILETNILQIIDHHMLAGGLATRKPLDVTIKTVASTATVIYDLMGTANETLPADISGLILSAILSDTLAFRSPTTTPHDRSIAEKIAMKLNLDIKTYSEKMFAAKSDVTDFTDIGLVHLDSKKSALGDKNIRVSVIETTTPKNILNRSEGIISAIKSIIAEEKDVDDVLFFIIDILNEEAIVLTYNQFTKDVIGASFGVEANRDTQTLPGILSRKKQIIPALTLPNL